MEQQEFFGSEIQIQGQEGVEEGSREVSDRDGPVSNGVSV